MLNLLIREKRYQLRHEYFKRVIAMFLLLMILVCIYYGILLFANTLLVKAERKIVERDTNSITESSLKKDLNSYEDLLSHLKIEYELFSHDATPPSKIISALLEKQVSGISLSLVSIQNGEDPDTASLEIKGIASTRDVLLSYSNSLKDNPMFGDINIPFSSLTKTTDIPFSLSIKAKINLKPDEKN